MDGGLTRREVMAAAGVAGLYVFAGGRPAAAAGPPGPGLRYYYPVRHGRPRLIRTDICIYGATSGGVAAAVQAARMGCTVALTAFGRHIGGVTASGLGATDTGNIDAIGGVAREFYGRVGARYGRTEVFKFEPHVAEEVFEQWVAESDVLLLREQRLQAARMHGGRIVELRMEGGNRYQASVFVDASYEGDLMAAAGVSWFAGREGNAAYGETLNGVQYFSGHQFRVPVDPYVVPGDPSSGLLEGIDPAPPGTVGEGDRRIQAYNFRVTLTKAADRLPLPRPRGYDPARYELLLRYIQAGIFDVLGNNQAMPNGKTDLNNNGAVATDDIGRGYAWPDGGYAHRERIFQEHVNYQQGLLWFLANDERVPASIRAQIGAFGLPRDEFLDTGGWPHELYVREGRRLVSDYVMAEHDCRGYRAAEDSIGLASYTMDSHNCKRVVVDGAARNEGNVEVGVPQPYPISYRSIVPRTAQCSNLLVPVCVASTHIAYGSIRMEPVFMQLGQAAATAAALAIREGVAVQDVDYATLRMQLRRDRMILEWPPPAGGLTIDAPELRPDTAATVSGALLNDSQDTYSGVTLTLAAPPGWTVSGPVDAGDVEPGGSVTAAWTVTAPVQDEPASAAELHATATYAGGEQVAAQPVYVLEPVSSLYTTFASTEAYFGQRGERFGIIAAGADIYTDADQYGALYREGAGADGTVAVTKLVSQDPTSPNARAGLVMRNDLTRPGAGAGYVLLVAKPQNGFLLLWDADGDGYVESVARADTGTTPYPAWLRLERHGSTFTGTYSLDAMTWTPIGSARVPTAAATQDVGLICCAHADVPGRALFDELSISTT